MARLILDDAWTGMREDDGRLAPVPERMRDGSAGDACFTLSPALLRQPETDLASASSYDDHQIGAVLKACAVCRQMRYFTRHGSSICGACRP